MNTQAHQQKDIQFHHKQNQNVFSYQVIIFSAECHSSQAFQIIYRFNIIWYSCEE